MEVLGRGCWKTWPIEDASTRASGKTMMTVGGSRKRTLTSVAEKRRAMASSTCDDERQRCRSSSGSDDGEQGDIWAGTNLPAGERQEGLGLHTKPPAELGGQQSARDGLRN